MFPFLISSANANPLACAVCSLAIAGGLSIAKWLGVDETAVGVWTGAFLFILAQWTNEWLMKKNIKNKYILVLSYILWFCAVIPLYVGEEPSIIFGQRNIIGIDAFLVSSIIGIITLVGGIKWYQYMKAKNGKPHFPFEKVVLPISLLIILSIIFNYAMK